jgi:hypothetical protein
MVKEARLLALSAVVICFVRCPASAQGHPAGPVMTTAGYSAFLQRFDDAVTRWIGYFQKIDAAKLQVSYVDGNKVMESRKLGLGQLSMLHEWVRAERVKPRLWRQIAMATTLQNIADTYAGLLWMLPQDSVPRQWDETYAKMAPEVTSLEGPLLNHVIKRADLLEHE